LQGKSTTNPIGVRALSDAVNPTLYYVSQPNLIFHGTPGVQPDTRILVYLDGQQDNPIALSTESTNAQDTDWWTDPSTDPLDAIPDDNAPHMARATIIQGDQVTKFSDPVTIQFSKKGPTLDSVGVSSPGPDLGVEMLTLRFTGNPLDRKLDETAANYLHQPSDPAATPITASSAELDNNRNSVNLKYSGLKADAYKLALKLNTTGGSTVLTDTFGNSITGETSVDVVNSPDGGSVDGIPSCRLPAAAAQAGCRTDLGHQHGGRGSRAACGRADEPRDPWHDPPAECAHQTLSIHSDRPCDRPLFDLKNRFLYPGPQLSGYKSKRFNWLEDGCSGSCSFDSLNA